MTAYEIALKAHDEAFKVFSAARDDYRNLKIGDVEFLAAKSVFDAATKVFDAAYAEAYDAAETDETEAEIVEENTQLNLF